MDEIVSFTRFPTPGSRPSWRRIGMHRDPSEDFDHPRSPSVTPSAVTSSGGCAATSGPRAPPRAPAGVGGPRCTPLTRTVGLGLLGDGHLRAAYHDEEWAWRPDDPPQFEFLRSREHRRAWWLTVLIARTATAGLRRLARRWCCIRRRAPRHPVQDPGIIRHRPRSSRRHQTRRPCSTACGRVAVRHLRRLRLGVSSATRSSEIPPARKVSPPGLSRPFEQLSAAFAAELFRLRRPTVILRRTSRLRVCGRTTSRAAFAERARGAEFQQGSALASRPSAARARTQCCGDRRRPTLRREALNQPQCEGRGEGEPPHDRRSPSSTTRS